MALGRWDGLDRFIWGRFFIFFWSIEVLVQCPLKSVESFGSVHKATYTLHANFGGVYSTWSYAWQCGLSLLPPPCQSLSLWWGRALASRELPEPFLVATLPFYHHHPTHTLSFSPLLVPFPAARVFSCGGERLQQLGSNRPLHGLG